LKCGCAENAAHKWTDKITNQRVLQQAEVGHVLRSGNVLQRVIYGRIQGKPKRLIEWLFNSTTTQKGQFVSTAGKETCSVG